MIIKSSVKQVFLYKITPVVDVSLSFGILTIKTGG